MKRLGEQTVQHADKPLVARRKPDEERFHLLVDSVTDYAILMLSPEGLIESWNMGAERISGYSEEEVVGKHCSVLYPLEDRRPERIEAELSAAKTEGRYEEEGWRLRKDGTRFWASVVLTPLHDKDQELRGYAKVLRDETQRRQLSESEEIFRLLVESVGDYAIFMLDSRGYVMSWNSGAQKIKGYQQDEIVGKHFSTFYTQDDIDREHPQEELQIARTQGRFEEEGWRLRKDGTRFWANVVITAVFEQDGTLRGFAKVTRDMTRRREVEEQLRDLNRQLESFAYSVSHDLRAPLRNIAFTSKLLLTDYASKLDAEGQELLHVQASSATKLASIINDLLTLSRLSRQEISREQLDLSQLAEEVREDVLSRGGPGVIPEVAVQPGITVNADGTLLRVIMLNLIDNAVKFSPNGGCITVGEQLMDGRPVFFVKDEGVGFEMAYAHKVFLPFERLVSEDKASGSGIGLANVQQAVLRHGGRIWVESEPGKGTTFFFTLG